MQYADQVLRRNPDNDFEVRCPIHGAIHFNEREKRLINHPFYQRLRHVTQLGFGPYVYPGAVHTRFSHSLGSMHLAGRIFDRLSKHGYPSLSESYQEDDLVYFKQLIRFTALLHDIGHPPFSHVAEVILPPLDELHVTFPVKQPLNRQASHEDFSLAVIQQLSQEKNPLLTTEEAADIIAILSGKQPESGKLSATYNGLNIFPLLVQIISGEIDADRMDYLLRDSYYAGVTYGQFDLNRLIRSLTCLLNDQTNCFHLLLAGSGIPAYEDFLLARSNMFVQVYFHKSLPALGFFLEQAFKSGELDLEITGDVSQFQYLTEHKVYEALYKASSKHWSSKILNREIAKTLVRWVAPSADRIQLGEEIHQFLQSRNIQSICSRPFNYFSTQTCLNEDSPENILVTQTEFNKTNILPISKASHLLKSSPEKIEIFQISVPREEYEKAIILTTDEFKGKV